VCGELAWGRGHALARDVLVGVAEDLAARRRPQGALDRRELEGRVRADGQLQVAEVGAVGLDDRA